MKTVKKLILIALALMLVVSALAEAGDVEPAPTLSGDDEAAPRPAAGYVLVSTETQSGWLPLPLEGEATYPLKQVLADGTETENLIHLTPDGVYMEDSTCVGHDCVNQGTVTLENREERILGNMIICLPNQVMLQLYSLEELLEYTQSEGAQ